MKNNYKKLDFFYRKWYIKFERSNCMIQFPITIQTMHVITGIPERTLRKYCEEMGIEKFGKGYMITKRIYNRLITRDAENEQYNRRDRNGIPVN